MLPLRLEDVAVSFPGLSAPVLSIPVLEIAPGERVAVTGPSGSGKSTFVNIITGLEKLKTGHASWGDTDLAALPEGRRDRWRGENIGLVMQDFHLFPGLSAYDNVLLPARLAHAADRSRLERAKALLETVGIARHDQKVETMSRGEMQRVAVARALLREPAIIVADEPTASLDSDAGAIVGELLLELAKSLGSTLIVVSHDERLVAPMARRISLLAGAIAADERKD
ncbi:ABC transporter ATP-binding protein [Martelella radicis]|uniref:Putative ABC transport system ATP-binding protein n=1 Tax=Martelella radicis TaxID=1397476 RepID=A0A7W6P9K2_9HYPH|nr:ABC transporter ATP-binding protein [Martelella radicis]MBB4122362.1 putative ABC transport system ATP-binding protein [Martelella radicis]